ncbi:universal stress protein [Actinophytocola sp.]|uniref:universal stress protein n=1 Tax=Actinophytocola sp. TaxID=1872138 RepID=UPI002D7416AE|nr:universal stress protein [Actinophytocola sp.]HYQ63988.1 universal stress protein [Actinophytocola sp.]
MTSHRKPVVVGVDGSATALHAVRWAAERARRDGLPLHMVHAYHLPLGHPSGVTEEASVLETLRQDGHRWLAEARDVAGVAAPGLAVRTELAAVPPMTMLLRESENASVLVLGSRGRTVLGDVLTGSTALALTSHAHCPVVLVRDGTDGSPRTGPVVVGVDGTQASEAAVAFAFAEAAAANAPLVALHAYTESVLETALAGNNAPLDWTLQRQVADRTLAERLAGWQEKYPQVRVEREAVHDRPTRALRRCARTARLMVVGRHGRGGFRDLVLGSTGQHLVHHADCPVAVVRTENPD